jgi:hypothetical protein
MTGDDDVVGLNHPEAAGSRRLGEASMLVAKLDSCGDLLADDA